MSALLTRRAARTHAKLAKRRHRLEAAVEAALTALDAFDGDPDLEDVGDDEPSLAGWLSSAHPLSPVGSQNDDREEEPGELENLLGWSEASSRCGRLDLGCDDLEPSLCTSATFASEDQSRRNTLWEMRGGDDDREDGENDAESGTWSEASSLTGNLNSGGEDAEHDGCSEPCLAWPEGAQFSDEHRIGGQDEHRIGGQDELEEACEDEGAETGDREPDFDSQGTPNRLWQIDGRDMWEVHGCTRDPLDPDDAPDTLHGDRVEWGMAR